MQINRTGAKIKQVSAIYARRAPESPLKAKRHHTDRLPPEAHNHTYRSPAGTAAPYAPFKAHAYMSYPQL